MPSKKPNKAAKRPGKATPKKATAKVQPLLKRRSAYADESKAHRHIEGNSETDQISIPFRDRQGGGRKSAARQAR